jgi:hypothetical protein
MQATLERFMQARGQPYELTPLSGRSDYAPFLELGVAAGGLETGAEEMKTVPSACCLLSAVCCLLSAVCCLLSAVCCLLSAVCCLLSVVCCLLPKLRSAAGGGDIRYLDNRTDPAKPTEPT